MRKPGMLKEALASQSLPQGVETKKDHPEVLAISSETRVRISEIRVYPFKSAEGIPLVEAELDHLGIKHDRRFVLVDEDGVLVSQRDIPQMSLVKTALTDTELILSAEGMEDFHFPLEGNEGEMVPIKVHKSFTHAVDQGDAAAEWFEKCLGHLKPRKLQDKTLRVVRFSDEITRPVEEGYAPEGTIVGLQDGYPLLMISEESLDDLNDRIDGEVPLKMNRFRPNIVVKGMEPNEELNLRAFSVNEVLMEGVKACERCSITMVEQETGIRGKEPLKKIKSYNTNEHGKPIFGQNVIHHGGEGKTIKVGDVIERLDD